MAVPKVSLEKVTASVTLPLPSGAGLRVKKNQKVEEGEVIAQRKASSRAKKYHLNKLISVPAKKTIKCLVKELGQSVKQGELVAQKKTILGKKERFIAPFNGVLDSLTEEGILIIKKEISEKTIKSPFAGVISEASKSSVKLTFAALEIKGSWGAGNKATGFLTLIEGEESDLFSLDGTCEQQIISLQGKLSRGLSYKAVSLGAVGFIVGGLLESSLEKEIKEDVDALPVVVLGEGGKINQEIWGELRKANGKMALIDGQQKRLLIYQS